MELAQPPLIKKADILASKLPALLKRLARHESNPAIEAVAWNSAAIARNPRQLIDG